MKKIWKQDAKESIWVQGEKVTKWWKELAWCFSDRASWIDYILITNFDALIIIYS